MTALAAKTAQGINVTASTTSWVTVAQITAGNLTAGVKYLIVASAFVRHASGANESRLRLVHGATPTLFDDGSAAYEETSAAQETSVGWMYVWTEPGTAEAITLEVSSSSTTTVTVEWGGVVAIPLTDLTEDTHYRYNEVLADYTTTASFADQALETFTPNGTDDWLIIGHGVISGVQTTTNYRMRLNDSVAGALATIDIEGEDNTNEIRSHLMMAVVTPTNASHTFSVQFNHETTAHTVRSSRIFCLNLNSLRNHAFSRNVAAEAPAASPTWTTTRTIAPTPDVTGDWLIWGYYSNDAGTLTDDVKTRLQINPSGGGLASDPAYSDSSPAADSWDATDILPSNIFRLRSLTSAASRTCNLDVSMVAGTTLRVIERTIVGFSMELPGGTAHALAGVVNASASTAAVVNVAHNLKGVVNGSATEAAAVKIVHSLAGAVNGAASVTADVKRTHSLQASVNAVTAQTAAVAAAHGLQAVVDGAASQSSLVQVAHSLQALTNGSVVQSAAVNVVHSLQATLSGAAAQTGILTLVRGLAGVISGSAVLTAAVNAAHMVSAVVSGESNIGAALGASHPLQVVLNALSSIGVLVPVAHSLRMLLSGTGNQDAALSSAHALQGVVSGESVVTITLEVSGGQNRAIAGVVNASGSDSAALAVHHSLAEAVSALTTMASTVSAEHTLRIEAAGAATFSGAMTVTHPLIGRIDGESILSAALTVQQPVLLAAQIAAVSTVAVSFEATLFRVLVFPSEAAALTNAFYDEAVLLTVMQKQGALLISEEDME